MALLFEVLRLEHILKNQHPTK